MELRMGGGDAYIYGPNSYLTFKLKVDNNSAGFGSGSVLNLFRSAEMKAHSGNEIDRLEEINIHALQHIKYSQERSFVTSGQAGLIGFSEAYDTGVTTADVTYCVPMKFILPMFGYPGLLPSNGLTAGSVIRITLEPVTTALVTGLAVGSYTITDPRIVTDELVLTDAFAKRLQLMSARSGPGLSLTWESWYHQRETSAAARVETQMANSVSRASRAWAVVRAVANQVPDQDSISALSAVGTITEYQYKLGNLRFPDQVCDNEREAFANALIAFQQYDKSSQPGVNLVAYETNSANGAAFDSGNRVIAASFERNHILQLSGIGVNGNRLLRVNLQKPAVNHTVDLFLEYVKYANVHLDLQLIST